MFLITLFNHIITLVYYFLIKPTTEPVKKQMDETTGSGMAKLKGIFEATVSHLIFLIKNVLVPRTSHIEGFHDLTKFLPVLDLSSKSINIPSLLMNSTKDFQGKIYKHLPGCKENHFSSLSFGQAEASIY